MSWLDPRLLLAAACLPAMLLLRTDGCLIYTSDDGSATEESDKTKTEWQLHHQRRQEPPTRPVYMGCYLDNQAEPDFEQHGGSRDRGMTLTRCAELCRARLAANMGLQDSECWCGNLYGNYGARHDDWCRVRCPDNPARSCGGVGYNSVYGLKP